MSDRSLTPARTSILAVAADRTAERQVREALRSFDIAVADGPELTEGARVVVLISATAAEDQEWMEAVSALDAGAIAGARMVPVRVGPINPEALPPALKDFNWVVWNDGSAKSAADLFVAFNSSPAIYEAHRVLATESAAWAAAGRSPDLLISDRRRAKQAQSHLVAAAQDQLSHVTETMQAFVAASATATGVERRKKIRRWLVRGVVVGIFAVVAISIISILRGYTATTALRGAVDLELNPDNYGREAQLASVVLVQGAGGDKQVVRTQLREILSHPWGEGTMFQGVDAAMNGAAVARRKNVVLTADGRGDLEVWNRRTGVATKRYALTDRLLGVDVRQDASLATAVSSNRLWLLTPLDDRPTRSVALPDKRISNVVLGASVAVAWSPTALHVVDAGSARMMRTIEADDVLAVRTLSDGDVRALVRRGATIALLDPGSGRTVARAKVPKWRYEYGGLGPHGQAALSGPDHQLHYAAKGLRFQPTGIAVPDAGFGITMVDRDHVVLADPEHGVRIVELSTGVELAQICQPLPSVRQISLVAGEPTVVCGDSAGVDIWPLDEILPLAAPPTLAQRSSARVNRRGDIEVTAGGDSRISMRNLKGPQHISYTGPAPRWRVATLHPRFGYVAAGSSDGRVMGFDADNTTITPVETWRVPTGLPITELGWNRDADLELYARTSDDRWWRVPTCILCAYDRPLVAYVRERLTKCQAPDRVKGFSDEAKKILQIKICPPIPKAEPR